MVKLISYSEFQTNYGHLINTNITLSGVLLNLDRSNHTKIARAMLMMNLAFRILETRIFVEYFSNF